MDLNKADVEEVKDISTTQNSVENKKKRKRSRWDQTGSSKVQATTEFSVDSEIRGVATTNSGGNGGGSSSSSSIGTTKIFVSTTTTDVTHSPPNSTVKTDSTQITSPQNTPEKKLYVKYSDTYKPGMIRVGSKWVYPEDEIIDGGTWEHKKRAEEMKKTAEHAALLTAQAEAKRAHHIADFLPKTELVKFEEEVKAIKTGGPAPQHEDYASNKLDQSNIGFKMLMKQGWQAGSGLGKSGEGISAPVNKADTRPTNAGLGQTKPDDVQEEDDEFEIYRKRMMLAYRFRPNPLNNPRRPYY